jgi:hypothetical protein
VSGQNGMEYIDLQKSYMYVRAKIMKTNGVEPREKKLE